MRVTIKRQGRMFEKGGSARYLKKMQKEIEAEIKNIHAEDLKRIESGRDIKGQFFPGYTPDYKERGRRQLGFKTNPVNLRRTGKLLDTIKNIVTLKGTRIEIVREIAGDQIEKASGLSRKRKFFGMTKRADEMIRALFSKLNIKELMR